MKSSLSLLKQYWGHEAFRSPQEEIIDSVLDKKDTIALLPTGGGKSICYQIPSLIFKGKTIVVSPLIALMQDQVNNLFSRGILAKTINSGMHYKEMEAILENFALGDLNLLYISPERIASDVFMSKISKIHLDLIAVDESHCISQWGYDFRPSYFNIPQLREQHPEATMMALTATATPQVLQDISEKLELKSPAIFKKSFARDNLSLSVIYGEDKYSELLRIISKVKGSSIVYVRNRRQTMEIGRWLTQHGISATSYHGGMDKSLRDKNQTAWMNNNVRTIVCTNAFGMGIDKPDVRLVVHLDLAPSLEEYFQEAGRAGRDGKPAYAVILAGDSDIADATINFNDKFPSLEIIASTYDRLSRYYKIAYGYGMMETHDFDLQELSEYLDLPAKKLYHIITVLEKEGWVATSDAFKNPSQILILANTQDLSYIQRTNGEKSDLIIHLLRKYEGLFIDYVKIDETRVAHKLRIPEPKVVSLLNILKAEGFLDYKPRTSVPQITFTRERPVQEHFSIDRKSYKQRKKMAEDRLNAMIKYLKNEEICRQKFIVNYFGEKGTECGKCDICLGSPSQKFSSEELNKILEHISKVAKSHSISIKEYVSLYPFNKRKRVINAIKNLESERYISIDNAGIIKPKDDV